MRTIRIGVGEGYHILNRGMQKQLVFRDFSDYARFLFLILFLQSPRSFDQVSREVHHFVKHRVFDICEEEMLEIAEGRYVELIAFCIMPNHFHLILRELEEGGIARYMQRVLNAYTKYFNAKYQVSGHLFQGPYRAVHVTDNNQLLYLSCYIHRNPRELPNWKNKEREYVWSSYQDYVKKNRWGRLLATELLIEQFGSPQEYETFVNSSSAKLMDFE
jgi:putative transposase